MIKIKFDLLENKTKSAVCACSLCTIEAVGRMTTLPHACTMQSFMFSSLLWQSVSQNLRIMNKHDHLYKSLKIHKESILNLSCDGTR